LISIPKISNGLKFSQLTKQRPLGPLQEEPSPQEGNTPIIYVPPPSSAIEIMHKKVAIMAKRSQERVK
jgi:hypothetical protein